jgi:hypothetical protein
MKAAIGRGRSVPFFFASGGYAWAWSDIDDPVDPVTTRGGRIFETGAGYEFNFDYAALSVRIGYKNQLITSEIGSLEEFGFLHVEERKINRIQMTIGLMFSP